jgi:hypothetical protein
VPAGIFPKLPEGSPLLLRVRWGRQNTHPELPGKEEGEAEDWRKRVFSLNA